MAHGPNQRDRGNRGDRGGDQDLFDKLVSINRVAKVVKGGRRFGFAALVVVGDGRGRVGYGIGKAREVPEAIRKATESAKTKLIRVPLREGRTLHHDVNGRYGAGKVVVRAAPAGTGIIVLHGYVWDFPRNYSVQFCSVQFSSIQFNLVATW